MKKFEFLYENEVMFCKYAITMIFEKYSGYNNNLYVIKFESDNNYFYVSNTMGFKYLGYYLDMTGEDTFRYIITNFKFLLIDNIYGFSEEEVDKIIDQLESLKVMKKLTE